MFFRLPIFRHAFLVAALAGPGLASATAQIGGVVSATFTQFGNVCNQTAQVPLTTLQDSFALSMSAPCTGGSVSGQLRGDTATGTIGLKVAATGTGFVAAQVSLADLWQLTPPPGSTAGIYAIPVTLHVEGMASGTAVLGTYLSYTLSLSDFFGGSRLDGIGSVTSAGAYARSFSGMVNVRYLGPGNPATVQVSAQMSVPNLTAGSVDFFNTAAIALDLPPGWTAVTSSGLPVVSVPEPHTALLLLAGLGVLGSLRRRR